MIDFAMRDTIAALATAPGQAGIAIVRVSGPRALEAVKTLFHPAAKSCTFESHMLYFGHFIADERVIDECMAVLMRAPRSYTRQDVAEFQLHGGQYAAQEALAALSGLGIRAAEPGEFTMRAFLNGRVDLSQAEAVMRVISASGKRSALAALRQLDGGASEFIKKAQADLLSMLASLEAALDFPEEIEAHETAASLAAQAQALRKTLLEAADERSARILEEGLNVALAGRPNAGKSTLLNALLQEERAIVTNIPGTTRDIVRGSILLEGLTVHLLDTAGIREGADEVEKIGVERAIKAAEQADVALLLLDASTRDDGIPEALKGGAIHNDRLIVYTKTDLAPNWKPRGDALYISAKTGDGMEALKAALCSYARHLGASPLTMRRHIELATQAASALSRAEQTFLGGAPLEFGAVPLHEALDALSAVTGDQVDEKLLDDIFSRFCVGK